MPKRTYSAETIERSRIKQREKYKNLSREEKERLKNESRRRYNENPYYKFYSHRQGSIRRGIRFDLTFEEWWKIWQDSGHWEERGTQGFHMCRKGDIGPYSIDNVVIEHHSKNHYDSLFYRGLEKFLNIVCEECKKKILCTL